MPQLREIGLLRNTPWIRVPGGEAVLQQAHAVHPTVLPGADLSPSGADLSPSRADLSPSGAARLRARGKVHPKAAAKAGLQSAGPEDKVEDTRSGVE